MAKTNISIEMSDKLADRFDKTCEDLGITPEEAMNIFAQKVVNEDGIPFEITEDDYPEEETFLEKVCKIMRIIAIAAAAVSAIVLLIQLLAKKKKRV